MDVNGLLYFLAKGIQEIFSDELRGIYLTGSLSYGDFNVGRSDIDLAVVLEKPALPEKIEAIKNLHLTAERKFKKWSERIECSYIPLEMLKNILPPKDPRPYFGEGKFYPAAPYGNEWLINKFFLYQYGIALFGPDFKNLCQPVDISDVKQASINDLFKEWEPKIKDAAYLKNSHYQSYVILNLCRILHTIERGETVCKTEAALRVKKEFPQWKNLIEAADSWHYGEKMERDKETVDFINFVIAKTREQKS